MRSATKLKLGKDPYYRAFLHDQACFVCRIFNQEQRFRTEAAHVGERGLSQKCPDVEALPCCAWHHTEGPESLHKLGVKFWTRWGLVKADLVAYYQRMYSEVAA